MVSKKSILVCVDIIIIFAAFYKGNVPLKKAKMLSYGVNQMGDTEGNVAGIHAEHDAIKKLLPLKRKKRLVNINLLVIRLSGKNKLQSSKPCINCIKIMKILPQRLGYKIQDIYYSNDNGEIEKSNLNILENDVPHYSRFHINKKNSIEFR
jgi:hypothetical protein